MRTTLFKKYAWIFGSLVGCALLLSGGLNMVAVYEESHNAMLKVQREKAQAAADQIAQYFFGIEQRIAMTTVTEGQYAVPPLQQRAAEIQYLRRTPAIRELRLLDAKGQEYLHVSRYVADVWRSGLDFSGADFFHRVKAGYSFRSPVYFRDALPCMTVALAVGPDEAGITVAEIDLEFLLGHVSRIQVGTAGVAYAVDTKGYLIAHPDMGLLLAHTQLAHLPQVRAALADTLRTDASNGHGQRPNGQAVLTAFGRIPQLDWLVFVEEPLTEAYRPLYRQVVRSGVLLLVSILLTVLACVLLVRRMVRPIEILNQGTISIGRGAFEHRIAIHTGDELEALAQGFNRMAAQLQESYGNLEQKVADRTQALQALNEKLATMSSTDSLTGIANRRRFDEALQMEWQRALRAQQPLALGLLDIDWFKRYNDHYGHQAGDECLRRVASVLAATICRSSDLVARYGGEEFAFIAPATHEGAALALAEKLGQSLRAVAIAHADSHFAAVTISVGVAVAVPDVRGSAQALLKAADQALYQAKAQGRNQTVLASFGAAARTNSVTSGSDPT